MNLNLKPFVHKKTELNFGSLQKARILQRTP
jgi:hypothetical protein